MHITHVGIVSETPYYMYNVIDSDPVVAKSRVVQENRTIAFFARPDYARSIRSDAEPLCNHLAAPWFLDTTAGKATSGVIVQPNYQSGTIWTGTVSGETPTSYTTISLFDEDHPFYLPAGTYHLSGAPMHHDLRSVYNNYRWGLRVFPKDGDSISFMMTGLSSATSSVDETITDTPTSTLADKVWDIGFGADFTLETGRWMCADIYISKMPDGSTEYSNTDMSADNWCPTLIRTA